TVFANVDTEKRHRVHERSSAENEKSPASVNLQGFSVRLTISLNPANNGPGQEDGGYITFVWQV
uniref:hypothetical protein n=1 Tax=Pseudomonas sp. BF-B-30 TaxID=2832388 RepID=UPI001CC01EB5